MAKKRKSLPPQTRREIKQATEKLVMSKAAEIQEEWRRQAIISTVANYGAVMCWTMRNKWGWGKQRINRLLCEVTETFDAVCGGWLSVDDIYDALIDEIGLDLRMDPGDYRDVQM